MKKNNLYVVDTHVLIWYFIGSSQLPGKIKTELDNCRLEGGTLLIPTIVLSEALDIYEKKRVRLDFPKMYELIEKETDFEIVGFTPEIFLETLKIENIQEIHDRIITATANYFDAGILTKDKIILNSGEI